MLRYDVTVVRSRVQGRSSRNVRWICWSSSEQQQRRLQQLHERRRLKADGSFKSLGTSTDLTYAVAAAGRERCCSARLSRCLLGCVPQRRQSLEEWMRQRTTARQKTTTVSSCWTSGIIQSTSTALPVYCKCYFIAMTFTPVASFQLITGSLTRSSSFPRLAAK